MTAANTMIAALLAASLAAASQQTFKVRTELVRLDVLVTDDGVPVAGLSAADFEVRDNGVLQRVHSAGAIEAVQLGVVLDTSGSMTGERIELARAAISELLGQLTPRDTLAVLAFGSEVGRVAARGGKVEAAIGSLSRLAAAGSTSLVDGLYAGVVEADGGPGPKLVLLMTDGRNNSSWLKAADVVDIARRRETVVYPVAVAAADGAAPDDASRQRLELPLTMGANKEWSGRMSPAFLTGDSLGLLRLIAEETGGRPIQAEWNRGLGDVFRRILAEYRQRYILSFSPEGVGTGDGWHTLEVRAKRRGLTVRSRTGYWAD